MVRPGKGSAVKINTLVDKAVDGAVDKSQKASILEDFNLFA